MAGGMYENYEDNLKREEYIDFNLKVVNNWKKYLYGFLFWNISYNKNSRDEFIEILYRIIKETGLKFLELIVWNKKSAMPIVSKEAMTRTYEDILVVGNDDSIREDIEMGAILRNSKEAFFNTKTKKWLNNYWEITVNKTQLDNHKACYPVSLPTKAILIMTKEKEIVADPFLGSGTTIIASEKTDRICYGMEISPLYTDVIVERWCRYTGITDIKKNGVDYKWKL
jgi:DNA modification methylase